MKKLIYFFPISFLLMACKTNEVTNEYEPSWLFWVFLGLIACGLIAGAFLKNKSIRNSSDNQLQNEDIPEQVAKEAALQELRDRKVSGEISEEEYQKERERILKQ